MSLEGSASSTNLKVLKGKIKSLSPYAVDPTLSVEGASADAKATGDALEKKVGFTDIVDDLKTNDSDRVLSAKQGVEIKKSIDNLRLSTTESIESLDQNIKSIQDSVTGAQNSADTAYTVAEAAQNSADGKIAPDGSVAMTSDFDMGDNKVLHMADPEEDTDGANKHYVDSRRMVCEVTLSKSGWATTTGEAPYTQRVTVTGILPTDQPHYGVVYSSNVDIAKEEKAAFALVDDLDTEDGAVVFTAFEERPGVTLTIQMEVNR